LNFQSGSIAKTGLILPNFKNKRMKKNNQEPVQVVLTYKSNSSENDGLRVKAITATEAENKITKLDDNDKLVRRYSFDDNGGGYLGL